MPVSDGLLFIDANIYLELYQLKTVKRLLASLTEQGDHIFVTQQVVSEVERNKLRVTEQSLTNQLVKLIASRVSVAGHFLADADEAPEKLRKLLHDIREKIDEANAAFVAHGIVALRHVSRSEDEVSKALIPIFGGAVPHKPDEIQRARERKERGFPPGKCNDPLGDELTWEQLLTACQGKTRVWIVTNDWDYMVRYGNEQFLNAVLYEEVVQRLRAPREVFCFNDIGDAIKHFTEVTKMKAEKLLTPEERAEIKMEREQLPLPEWIPRRRPAQHLDWLSHESGDIAIQHADAQRRRSALIAAISSGPVQPLP